MVYKTKFLKQVIENNLAISKDGAITWELSDQPLSAVWITVKGTGSVDHMDRWSPLAALEMIDVWFGGFNVMHYSDCYKAMLMNCKLKGAWPYNISNIASDNGDVGITFPLLFGAPYLNEQMAIPASLNNRKKLTLVLNSAPTGVTDIVLDLAEVILPDASPLGFIKQEDSIVSSKGTGDHDLWLQTNWDLLKLLICSPTLGYEPTWISTIMRAGLEINDFAFGYKAVPWEILHGELMDELESYADIEELRDSGSTGISSAWLLGLDKLIGHYAQMDFFYNHDLKWRAPLANASTAKLKYNAGIDENFDIATAVYVPSSKVS